MTQGERLMRIETLLETAAKELSEVKADVRALRADHEADKAELQQLKNRGIGLLIGVGIAGGAVGTAITKMVDAFLP